MSKTYTEIIKMAKTYGVDKNALFVSAAKQYALQQEVILRVKEEIEADENGLLTSKEYVKGRENVYVNPLVKELPKMSDSANRTAQTMLDIIKNLGREPMQASKLEALIND